jgi:hypothetical protein
MWIAARHSRAADFKGDALQLLQSLPDSGLTSIGVFDRQGPAHEATFQLDGLAAVPQKVLAACKATPAAEQASAHQRRQLVGQRSTKTIATPHSTCTDSGGRASAMK